MSAGKQDVKPSAILQVIVDHIESELSENESTHDKQDEEDSSDDPEKEMYKNITEEQLRRAREHNECFICNKRLGSFSSFRKHVVGHTNVKRFVCEICSKAFAKLTYLKAHLTIHNDNRIFTCEICSQNFATKPSIRGHMRIHSGHRPYKCDVCDRAFTESSTRRKHRMTHFGIKRKQFPSRSSHTCEYCGKMLHSQYSFNRHLKIHISENDSESASTEPCPICNKRVKSLKVHIKYHEKSRDIKCDLCDAMFKDAHSLKKHMVRHTGDKDYACDVCERKFGSSSNLASHRRTHTGDKRYVCDICNRAFTLSSTLRKHRFTHDNVDGSKSAKNFKCLICEKQFAMNYLLQTHLKTHTGDRPKEHICDRCSKGFHHRSSLSKHRKRPCFREKSVFQCDVCPKQFKANYKLQRHLERHARILQMQGDEDGNCKICGKTFPTSHSLSVHLSEHIDVKESKTFQCEICSHKYASEGNLKKHFIKTHGDSLLECEICQTDSFTSREKLDAHRAKHFTEIVNEAGLAGQTNERYSTSMTMKREDGESAPNQSNSSLYSVYAEAVSKFYRNF